MSTEPSPAAPGRQSGPPRLFDEAAREAAQRRARHGYAEAAFLGVRAAEIAADRLADVTRRFDRALLTGLAAPLLDGALPADKAAAREVLEIAPDILPVEEGTYDLAVSLLELHALNDPVGRLIQINRALRPDGLFVGVGFGGETLHELRHALAQAEAEVEGGMSPRVFPFMDVRDAGTLLQRAGFALPVADCERVVARYADPLALLADLRSMGETNALADRRKGFLRETTLLRAMEIYRERFEEADGKSPATFDIVTLTGWAPHASQPKPLRPGSAVARLADALGTAEVSAGEKAGG